MRPGGGRAKGSAFEREVAKMIVATFASKGITKEDCYRTPLSGGHVYASKKDPGDLQISAALAKLFPYSVECKSYRSLPWEKLVRRTTSIFDKWWEQALRAAEGTKRLPILVFKQNGSPAYVMYRHNMTMYPKTPAFYLKTAIGIDRVRVLQLEEFLWMVAKCGN